MRTSLYSILCILIRLGAVLLAVSTITVIPAVWRAAESEHVDGYTGTLLGFGILMLAIAALLWIYPGVLARLAGGKASEQIFESPISADELQQLALTVVGVWFVIDALSALVSAGAGIVVTTYMTDGDLSHVPLSAVVRSELGRVVPPAVKLMLGIALAMNARGLVGWIRALKERGLPPATEGGGGTEAR